MGDGAALAWSCFDLGGLRCTVDPGEVSGEFGPPAERVGERGPAVFGFLLGRVGAGWLPYKPSPPP